MLIKKPADIPYSQVTPKQTYLNRRRFLASAGGAVALAAAGGFAGLASSSRSYGATTLSAAKSPYSTTEKVTPFDYVTHYNNFYEFGTDKEDPARHAQTLRTKPWTISIEGEVAKKRVIDMDAAMKLAPLEERIYRHRCVEAWSIVVPWIGFPLSALIKLAEPTSKAKYVAFQSLYDRSEMPQAQYAGIPFPYVEGLRMDEAMHPLTILTVGMYGQILPNQDGAPIRLTVPWKYGFKSIKSIVKVKFVSHEPSTTWDTENPSWYGFYSNVNPNVSRPRWSQAKERRLGEFFKRDTLMFNGYGKEVASLYSGMDLSKYY
jgi:methionine sulfoxide reductase catalytic subunit